MWILPHLVKARGMQSDGGKIDVKDKKGRMWHSEGMLKLDYNIATSVPFIKPIGREDTLSVER